MRAQIGISIVLTLACLAGCEKESSGQKRKENFEYWSNAPGNTCAKMAGRDYCFEERVIAAKNWLTDTVPGFLLNVPLRDLKLIDCNRQRYSLESDQSPSVSSTVGHGGSLRLLNEMSKKYGSTPRAVFESMNKSFYYAGLNMGPSGDIIFPHQLVKYYDMTCVRTKPNAVYKQEAECQVGKYGDMPPPHFFSCDKNGSVPYPSCSNWMFYKDLELHITYNKKCAPLNSLIRKRVVEYIDEMEVLRGNK
jgi:hypothetical protein